MPNTRYSTASHVSVLMPAVQHPTTTSPWRECDSAMPHELRLAWFLLTADLIVNADDILLFGLLVPSNCAYFTPVQLRKREPKETSMQHRECA